MARSYSAADVRARIITVLSDAESPMSGVEIARALGMSRTTATTYLKLLAADNTLACKNIGNITLWSLEQGQESFTFPDDYFKAAAAYGQCIKDASETDALRLVGNCIRSGASAERVVYEVLMPAADLIYEMYDDGTIGSAEQKLLYHMVMRSLFVMDGCMPTPDPKKGVIIAAADTFSDLASHIVSAAYRSRGWSVFELGYMHDAAAGVMFDLDYQKLTDRIWAGRQGILLTVALSNTAEGLHFFADSIYPVTKRSRHMHLALCRYRIGKSESDPIPCDHIADYTDMGSLVQWSDALATR